MKATVINDHFAVFDDVLAEEDMRAFWQMFLHAPLRHVHADGLRDYYRPSDGLPYTGGNVAWTAVPADTLLPANIPREALKAQFYPTGDALDPVFDALQRAARQCTDIVGQAGHDYVGVLARLYAYPAGTRISWHSDADDCTGAFIFYGNPSWRVEWGGELLIADRAARHALPRKAFHDFDNDHESAVLLRQGMGHYVMPRPGRLVLLGAGTPHAVEKVLPAAGDHVRASFAGFFMTGAGTTSLIQNWLQNAQ